MDTSTLRSRTSKLCREPLHPDNGYSPLGSDITESHKLHETKLNVGAWFVIVLFCVSVFLLSFHYDEKLPMPITLGVDVPSEDVFTESFAREFLSKIVAFGPRVSGSDAAEILATNLIVSQVESIKANALPGIYEVDLDIQRPSGCFSMQFFSPTTSCYRNLTNIIVRLSPSSRPASDLRHAVLLNCHFDSVPDSPGASDDAVSCAVLIEILRALTRTRYPLIHDVIFLFNGAEENFLQASHGFITQHPWRHTVRTFINVEACGAGGREMVFQAGPGNPWLMKAYITNAPYPHTSVMAQEVFQGGFIPSDTDFRIFRDYGRIPGLDLAYVKNGYVYHTEFDTEDYIPPGAIQRAGENILATLRVLANSSFLSHPGAYEHLQERIVFFDILGLFGIQYPHWLGIVLNIAVVVAVYVKVMLAVSGRTKGDNSYTVKEILMALATNVAALLASIAAVLVWAHGLTLIKLTMVWYARPWVMIFFYVLPGVGAGFTIHVLAKKFWIGKGLWRVEQCYFDAHLVITSAILALLTIKDFGSAYFLLVYTMFPLLRPVLCGIYAKVFSVQRPPPVAFLIFHLLSVFWSALFAAMCFLQTTIVFVPIMGRVGANANPEIIIGCICVLAVATVIVGVSSLIYVTRHSKYIVHLLFSASLMFIVGCYWSDLSIPYNYSLEAPRLRRLHLQHASRKVFAMNDTETFSDTGIWIVPLDYRGAVDLPSYSFLSSSKPVSEVCAVDDYYCGLPYYIPLRAMFFDDTRWMQTPTGPTISTPLQLALVSRETYIEDGVPFTILHLNVSGPDHLTMFLTPRNDWILETWSFTKTMEVPAVISYFVYLAEGSNGGNWSFSLKFWHSDAAPALNKLKSLPVVTVTVSSHILHGPEKHSVPLQNVVALTEERRKKADLGHSWWRWQNTVQAWTSELIAHDF